MGVFVVLEGGEGSGKSTQARLLYQRLQQEGYAVVHLHEPGGTPLGEQVRRLLIAQRGKAIITPLAELLLFSAARAELVSAVLRPALDKGWVVVCDRYTPSTVAYQGYGRALPKRTIEAANRIATGGLRPDLIVLLDLPPEVGLRRVKAQVALPLGDDEEIRPIPRGDEEGHQRFEEEPLDFHHRVRRGYLAMAKADSQRWLVVDGVLPVERIAEIIWQRVQPLAQERLPGRGQG